MLSKSEQEGIDAIRPEDRQIYSVGISSFAEAELVMAQRECSIVATTIDAEGLAASIEKITQTPYAHRINAKYEDIREPLPYADESFDFVYARLVLHYLDKDECRRSLAELHRITRPGGRLYAVFRSTREPELQHPATTHDTERDLTTYPVGSDPTGKKLATRRFFTPQKLRDDLTSAGYAVLRVEEYEERLTMDFKREQPNKQMNTIISALAER